MAKLTKGQIIANAVIANAETLKANATKKYLLDFSKTIDVTAQSWKVYVSELLKIGIDFYNLGSNSTAKKSGLEIMKLQNSDFEGKSIFEKVDFLNSFSSGFCNLSTARGNKAIYFNLDKSIDFSEFANAKNIVCFMVLEGADCANINYDWKSWFKAQHASYANNEDMLNNMLSNNQTPDGEYDLVSVITHLEEVFWAGKDWTEIRKQA